MSHRVGRGGGAALLVLGLLAACSRGGATTATNPSPGPRAQFQAYADCMREHGVPITVPSGRTSAGRPSDGVRPSARGFPGGGPPPGVDQATWDKAQQACAGLRPSGAASGRDNGAITAYRNCLRDHGVTDPRPEQASADPALAAALAACAPLRPSPR